MYQGIEDHLRQGDIFTNVPTVVLGPDGQPAVRSVGLAIVVSRCCEVKPGQKKGLDSCHLAQVHPLSHITDTSQWPIVRRRAKKNAFYMEAHAKLQDIEHVADLRTIAMTHPAFLHKLINDGCRVLSLNDEARKALSWALAVFFGYEKPADAPTGETPVESARGREAIK